MIYLFERLGEGETCPLAPSLNGCCGRGWARREPGVRSSIWASPMGAGPSRLPGVRKETRVHVCAQDGAWESAGQCLGRSLPRLLAAPPGHRAAFWAQHLPPCLPLPPPPAPAPSGGVGSWVLHPRGQGCSIGAAADPRAGLAKPVHLRGDAFGVQVTRWPRDTPQLSVNPTALGTLLAQVRHYPPRVFRRDPWGPCCPLSLSKASAYPEGN